MRLGIIGNPDRKSFFKAARLDLEFLEFCINVNKDVDEFASSVEDIKTWMEESGVAVGSIGRWGSDRIDQEGNVIEEELQKTYKLIDACAELSCPVFNCGVNYVESFTFEENCQFAINFLAKAVEYGKSKGVKVATYNCRWNNFVVDAKAWEIVHNEIDDLGIKFDPSHSFYADGDYLNEMKEWGHRFEHFHIKGGLKVNGERYDDPPAGMDQIQWPSVMATLYAVGYDKTLSLEPHSKTWQGELGEKGIQFTLDFIKPFILQ